VYTSKARHLPTIVRPYEGGVRPAQQCAGPAGRTRSDVSTGDPMVSASARLPCKRGRWLLESFVQQWESTMRLTLADVEHVAALARLGLTDEEKERMRQQLSSILEHIATLNEVDTSAIPPTAQVITLTNVMRDDIVCPSLPVDAVLANAPRRSGNFFEVHTPLGGEEELP
jgi:aspartyl-tRNA(Asn)/glutamyl-tRNA(Gln) amidotransferase subunit C